MAFSTVGILTEGLSGVIHWLLMWLIVIALILVAGLIAFNIAKEALGLILSTPTKDAEMRRAARVSARQQINIINSAAERYVPVGSSE